MLKSTIEPAGPGPTGEPTETPSLNQNKAGNGADTSADARKRKQFWISVIASLAILAAVWYYARDKR